MELEEPGSQTSDYTTKHSNQDSMVLTQKQKYRPMEKDRKRRDKPTYIWSLYL